MMARLLCALLIAALRDCFLGCSVEPAPLSELLFFELERLYVCAGGNAGRWLGI